jgi:hypothetical protein
MTQGDDLGHAITVKRANYFLSPFKVYARPQSQLARECTSEQAYTVKPSSYQVLQDILIVLPERSCREKFLQEAKNLAVIDFRPATLCTTVRRTNKSILPVNVSANSVRPRTAESKTKEISQRRNACVGFERNLYVHVHFGH